MREALVELYRGYLLRCAPSSTPEGRYLAKLVVSFAEHGGHEDVSITPKAPSFATPREAADCSLAVGKHWIDAKL